MDNLEPITRNEMFLNGDDLEPITREEMILAGADLDPITRHEWFLKRYRGGGGGGGYDLVNIPDLPADIASFNDGTDLPMASLKVTVTPYQDLHGYDAPWAGGAGKNKFGIKEWLDTNEITYTQNGNSYTFNLDNKLYSYKWEFSDTDIATNFKATITIPSGSTASNVGFVLYNQSGTAVTGRVNEYSNKTGCKIGLDWSSLGQVTITEAIVTKSTDSVTPFTPYSNICPIIGWDEAVVTVADDAESPTTSHEYTIDLDGTRYGGTLDVTTGVLTVDRAIVDMGDLNYTYYENNKRFAVRLDDGKPSRTSYGLNTALCECYPVVTSKNSSMADGSVSVGSNFFSSSICSLIIHDENYTDATAFKTSVNGQELVYELATPITVQLAPTPVKSLEGTNKIFANCGQITEGKYFKRA